eukprot:2257833-Rhodomonas_salina.1
MKEESAAKIQRNWRRWRKSKVPENVPPPCASSPPGEDVPLPVTCGCSLQPVTYCTQWLFAATCDLRDLRTQADLRTRAGGREGGGQP